MRARLVFRDASLLRRGEILASKLDIPYLRLMEVHFATEQEAQPQLATKTGTDAEHLVKDAVLRLLQEETHVPAARPELPVLNLGTMKSLRRRDIYDDVR
jgi:hypothetical protein